MSKLQQLEDEICDVCDRKKQDIVKVKKNWFTDVKICDSCCSKIFKLYRKELKN